MVGSPREEEKNARKIFLRLRVGAIRTVKVWLRETPILPFLWLDRLTIAFRDAEEVFAAL